MSKKPTPPVRSRTESEYHTTQKYLQQWKTSAGGNTFADFLLTRKLAQATRCKHLRQANTLYKRKNMSTDNLGTLKPPIDRPPIQFSNNDFEALYNAFNHPPKPAFIEESERHRYRAQSNSSCGNLSNLVESTVVFLLSNDDTRC